VTYVLAIIAGITGLVVGWAAATAAMIGVGTLFGMSNFEGALGMQAVFGAGPIGGIAGLVLGIWLVLRRRGHRRLGAVAWRLPVVILAIAGLAAGVIWYLYETRTNLGTSSSGAPRLDFEIRLPPGTELAAAPSRIRIELNTEHNRMPGQVFDRRGRKEGDRQVVAGSVELAYRSSWRLLEMTVPGEPARIFDLKLSARPGHMKTFGPWRRVDFIAVGEQQPRRATDADAYEIRTRVVYRDAELAEESGASGNR
jgi:MFS family permease